MKKKIFTIVALFLVTSTILKAQMFVGGAFSLATSSSKFSAGAVSLDGDKTFSFNFSPKAGYFLNDKFAIGLGFGFGTSKTTTPKELTASGEEEVSKANSWAIAPFARYYFAKSGDLSFFGEATLGFGGGKSEISAGAVTVDGPKTSMIGISVAPAISYDLGKKFAIEASFGGLGFASSTSKETIKDDEGNDVESKDTSSGINLSLDLTSLSFGAIFKF
ncbi:MAG: outer membrane beta-barrel protein [Bacteroidales bacterium]